MDGMHVTYHTIPFEDGELISFQSGNNNSDGQKVDITAKFCRLLSIDRKVNRVSGYGANQSLSWNRFIPTAESMGWRSMYKNVTGGMLSREWRRGELGLLMLLVVVVVVAATDMVMRRRRKGGELGGSGLPNPAGLTLPWIGHLLQMILFSGGLPHRWFYELSRSHGGGALFMLWLGRIPVLVVSSAPAARLVLRDHDVAFASRPSTSAGRTLFYGPSDLAFSTYGPYWRKVKELLMTNLFCTAKIQAFSPIRAQELLRLTSSISAHSSSPQLIRSKVFDMAFNNVSRMSLGRTIRDLSPDFMEVAQDTLDLLGAFNIGDFLPAIRWLDLQGYERRIKATHRKVDEILQRIIDDRRKELETSKKDTMNSENPRIFLDVLLMDFDHGINGSKVKDDSIKAILLDLFVAGSETISTTIEWALSELLRNKEIMMELTEELDNVIGRHCLMQEAYVPKLPFLQAVVKETLRLHPPGPLLVPHEATTPCKLGGYDVPTKSTTFVNTWAIGRDESVWEKPLDFRPHRFLNSTIDVKGHHYQLLPFGGGRRACIAMNLGLLSIQLTLATLVHCFEWSLPDGMERIDMNEKFGLNVHKAIPLMVTATPRL